MVFAYYLFYNIQYCVLGALASSSDSTVVLEALNFLITPEVSCAFMFLVPQHITFFVFYCTVFIICTVQVRNQDVVHGLGGISIEGRDVAWTWLKVTQC